MAIHPSPENDDVASTTEAAQEEGVADAKGKEGAEAREVARQRRGAFHQDLKRRGSRWRQGSLIRGAPARSVEHRAGRKRAILARKPAHHRRDLVDGAEAA